MCRSCGEAGERVFLVLIGAALLVSFCVTSVEAQTAPEREWKASFAEVVRENQDAVVQVIAEVSKFEKTVHDPRCERGGHGQDPVPRADCVPRRGGAPFPDGTDRGGEAYGFGRRRAPEEEGGRGRRVSRGAALTSSPVRGILRNSMIRT